MKKIIFLDLDGTLWQNGKIPESAIKAIHLAQFKGNKVILNTGRSRCEISTSIYVLGLDGYCFSAGSEIWLDGLCIFYHPMDSNLVKDVQRKLSRMNYRYSLEGSKVTFSEDRSKLISEIGNRVGNGYPPVKTMKDSDYEQIMKISIHSLWKISKRKMKEILPDGLEYTKFGRFGGEITDKRYNKATAIQCVVDYYGPQYLTVSMGDSENDLSMLNRSDISVAMGNASKEVQRSVDFVTDDIQKKGLYKAFKRLRFI